MRKRRRERDESPPTVGDEILTATKAILATIACIGLVFIILTYMDVWKYIF